MPKDRNGGADARVVHLGDLSPQARARVERALAPRDTMLSRRFPAASVAAWSSAAEANGETLTAWMQRVLDWASRVQLF